MKFVKCSETRITGAALFDVLDSFSDVSQTCHNTRDRLLPDTPTGAASCCLEQKNYADSVEEEDTDAAMLCSKYLRRTS